jgi:hypothetical protein
VHLQGLRSLVRLALVSLIKESWQGRVREGRKQEISRKRESTEPREKDARRMAKLMGKMDRGTALWLQQG